MKGQSVAHALHARLTEEGLKRVITKTLLINRLDIDELSPDDLARLITIEPLKMSRGGRVTVRAAKAAKNLDAARIIGHASKKRFTSSFARMTENTPRSVDNLPKENHRPHLSQ